MEPGQIITFYSYKGGVGRSFALANTAVLLARWGYRVLCIDWDLEAPGLSYFFGKYLEKRPRAGLLEMVEAARDAPGPQRMALANRTTVTLPGDARLDLIAAGRQDETYVSRLQEIDWEELYVRHDFGATLERWREEWTRNYDLVLVDSRTGITDSGGICTAQVPDVLVFAYTANQQNVDGVLDIVDRAMKARDGLPYDRPRLLTVPLLSRFDAQPEYEQGETWRRNLADRMRPRLRDWAPKGSSAEELLQRVTIPYFPVWSFGESLPALTENHRNSEQVTYSVANLAALLARRLEDARLLIENRDSYVDSAVQAARRSYEADVFVSHSRRTVGLAREFIGLLHENGVTTGTVDDERDRDLAVPVGEYRRQFIDDCRHFALIVDEYGPSSEQNLDVSYFLRHSLNAATERLALPVVTTSDALRTLPPAASTLQAFILDSGSLSQAARAIAARIRPESTHLEFDSRSKTRNGRYDVYVSYTYTDENWAMALAENLQRLGLNVWVDQWELRPGDHWPSRLEDGLQSADTVVAVVGREWSRSHWAGEEFAAALAADRAGRLRVIPVIVEDVVLPPQVASLSFADFRDVSSPREYVTEVNRLARTILRLPDDDASLSRSGSVVLPDTLL